MRFSQLILLILSAFCASVFAEQKHVYGDTEIHYSAFSSAFLQPEVATAYEIQRSRYRGVVSISIKKAGDGLEVESMPAVVTGKAINLSSQEKDLEFKEVRSEGAIYYLATFPYADDENLRFVVNVMPEGMNKPQTIEFWQDFYVE